MALACTLLTWHQLTPLITDSRGRQVHDVGLECSIRMRERSQSASSRATDPQPAAARGQPSAAAPAARGQPSAAAAAAAANNNNSGCC